MVIPKLKILEKKQIDNIALHHLFLQQVPYQYYFLHITFYSLYFQITFTYYGHVSTFSNEILDEA